MALVAFGFGAPSSGRPATSCADYPANQTDKLIKHRRIEALRFQFTINGMKRRSRWHKINVAPLMKCGEVCGKRVESSWGFLFLSFGWYYISQLPRFGLSARLDWGRDDICINIAYSWAIFALIISVSPGFGSLFGSWLDGFALDFVLIAIAQAYNMETSLSAPESNRNNNESE